MGDKAREWFKKALVSLGLAYEEEEDYKEEGFEEEEGQPMVRKLERSPDLNRARKTAHLRSITTPEMRVHLVQPRNFNDAQQIADKLKANVPIILNLQQNDSELSRRLIDFASGLTYGLSGGMQKIAKRVFLLTPPNVEVSAEERRRLRERGFFDQFQAEL